MHTDSDGPRRLAAREFCLIAAMLLAPAVVFGVDGTVINQTTGKPQAGVIVSLIQPGQGGMQTLGSGKTDAAGKFNIDKTGDAGGPVLVQALYAGVPYNKMLPPGTPSSGVELAVFDSTKTAPAGLMNQHMVLLQPAEKGLRVNEMFLLRNTSKETYNDAAKGTLRFYMMPAHGDVRVTISAPGGMPIQRPAEKTEKDGVYKVAYAIKPGETRFDVSYALEGDANEFSGKAVLKGGPTRLVAPKGVTIEGEGVTQLGEEPQTQAKIYGVASDDYTVKVSGTGSLDLGGAAAGGEGAADKEDLGQPQITQSFPRIYDRLYIVMGLSLAILALGLVVLYRNNAGDVRK